MEFIKDKMYIVEVFVTEESDEELYPLHHGIFWTIEPQKSLDTFLNNDETITEGFAIIRNISKE